MDPIEIELENEIYVQLMLNYLSILQEGRVKPNSNKSVQESIVRDSIDNLKDITGVKERLNEIFSVTPMKRDNNN